MGLDHYCFGSGLHVITIILEKEIKYFKGKYYFVGKQILNDEGKLIKSISFNLRHIFIFFL